MSNPNPPRSGIIEYIEMVPDPGKDARLSKLSQAYHNSALSQLGFAVAEASPDLLARYIAAEMEAADRQQLLAELITRLSEDDLRTLGDGLQARLGRGAA